MVLGRLGYAAARGDEDRNGGRNERIRSLKPVHTKATTRQPLVAMPGVNGVVP